MKGMVKSVLAFLPMIFIVNIFSGCLCYRNNSIAKYEKEICQNKNLMDFYLSKEFDINLIDREFEILNNDKQSDNYENFAAYFRFLSIVSGLESPYNYEPKYIINRSYELSHDYRNIKLIDWYVNNKDSVSCELFDEYYQIELGLMHGPRITSYKNDDDLNCQIENYGDSVFGRLRDFKIKNSPLIALGDTTVLQEDCITKDTVLLKQIVRIESQALNTLLNRLIVSDKPQFQKTTSYSVDIQSYNGQQLVRIVKYGEAYTSLLYSENGYDGYILMHDIPVIISSDKSLKLHFNELENSKEFKMLSKYYPISHHLTDKLFFEISGNSYVKIENRTGIDMWNEILLQKEMKSIPKFSTLR